MPRRCSPGSTPPRWTPRGRLALLGALALQNRAAELITVAQASLAGPARLQPSDQVLMLAQQSWVLTYTGDPRAGESAASRALVIAERAGDAAMTVWALTALMVAVGRQAATARRWTAPGGAAALAADSPDTTDDVDGWPRCRRQVDEIIGPLRGHPRPGIAPQHEDRAALAAAARPCRFC